MISWRSVALELAGFRQAEFLCFDNSGGFAVYLPRGVRWLPRLYTRSVHALNWPRTMGTVMRKAAL